MENNKASEKVFRWINDSQVCPGDSFPMGKRAEPDETPWFPNEWLAVTGKKQVDLVKGSGYDKSYVSLLLSGDKRWNETVLARFARALRITPGALLIDPSTPQGQIFAAALGVPKGRLDAALRMLKALADESQSA